MLSKLHTNAFLSQFDLGRGVFVLYLTSLGMTAENVSFLQFMLWMGILFLEIPSGMIADYLGKKKTIIFGFVLMIFNTAGYLIFTDFTSFVILFLIHGFAIALRSGADVSLLYENLEHDGQVDIYQRALSWLRMMETVALLIAMPLGALLYDEIGGRAVFMICLGVSALGLFNSLMLQEFKPPLRHKISWAELWQSGAWRDYSVDALSSIRALLPMVMAFGLFDGIITFTHLFAQKTLVDYGLSMQWVGVFYFLVMALGAVLYAVIGETQQAKWHRWGIMLVSLLVFAVFAVLFVMGDAIDPRLVFGLLVLVCVVYPFYEIPYNVALQERATPDIRATYMSTCSFVGSLGLVLIFLMNSNSFIYDNVMAVFMGMMAIVVIANIIMFTGRSKVV